MSLTSELRTSGSPIREFLRSHFPRYRPIQSEARKILAGVTTIRPSRDVPYSTIGTALDYRIRYFFAVTPSRELVAWHGALLGSGMLGMRWRAESLSRELVRQFFNRWESELRRLQPVGRALNRADDALLARYCIVLAFFEELYRAGAWIDSPLFSLPVNAQVDDLLALVKPHWVTDLRALTSAFHEEWGDQLSKPTIPNPTFEGSHDIRGADADLIVDGCLVDIKTTLKPSISVEWLRQLLGYLLLDYSDQYQIREVAIYLARQRVTIRWPVRTLLLAMTGDDAPSLADLRTQFEQVVSENWLKTARIRFNTAIPVKSFYRLLAYSFLDPEERRLARLISSRSWERSLKASDLIDVLVGDPALLDTVVRPGFERINALATVEAVEASSQAPDSRQASSAEGRPIAP